MAFKLLKDPMETQVEALPISSKTITLGQCLELDAGATTWTSADASTLHWQRKAVAIEAATTSDSEVKCILVTPWQLWEALGANVNAAADNGDRMLIASGGLTVTNASADDTSQEANFVQLHHLGTDGTDYGLVGYFLGGTGVDPDAA